MKQTLAVASKGINTLVNKVRDFVKENGGFISTHDIGADTIYAYVLDWDLDIVTEERVLAVRVNNDILEIICTPYKNDTYDTPIEEKNCTDEDWYSVGDCGDCILRAQTILSIAESIDQYV